MRKLFLSSAIVMAMGTVSIATHAAETASLSITGSIAPSSCDISLSAATIDLGNINASTLSEALNTQSGEDITVTLGCEAATAVAVQTTDNRTASAMTLAEATSEMGNLPGIVDANLFGLGTDSSGAKIGALILGVTGASVDGSDNPNLLNSADMASWAAKSVSPTSGQYVMKNGYFASASAAGETTPVAVTNATYTLSSVAVLKASGKYPGGESIDLDGNVTFSVVYL